MDRIDAPPAGFKVVSPFTIPAGTNEGLIYITAEKSVPITSFSGLVTATAAGATESKIEWFTLNVRRVM